MKAPFFPPENWFEQNPHAQSLQAHSRFHEVTRGNKRGKFYFESITQHSILMAFKVKSEIS